jgi:phosphonatase-like hydrolase
MNLPKLIINSRVNAIICDMAGTTVNEGGIIYKTLYNTIKNFNLKIGDESEIEQWHGANKYEVLDHYLRRTHHSGTYFRELQPKLHKKLNENLLESYSNPNNISLIHEDLPKHFNSLREKNVKIFLNTGYPIDIQESIIKTLNMDEFIDDYISSEEVVKGRPKSYMIDALLKRNYLFRKNVIKIGDTPNDIKEGLNAECLMSVGVLTGASNYDVLRRAYPNMIINSVMDIEYE